MRKILFIVMALWFVTPTLMAQDKDTKEVVKKNETTGEYSYEDVVLVENVTKGVMFERAKKWIISNIVTGDNNIKFDSVTSDIVTSSSIILKTGSGFTFGITSGYINFKLNIQFKDGRYKFVFNGISVHAVFDEGTVKTLAYDQILKDRGSAKFIRKDVNEKLQAISTQLENTIIKVETSTNDNW